MEFNEIMNTLLRILDMLDKIYHTIIKEAPEDGSNDVHDN